MRDSIKPVVRAKETPIPRMSVGRTQVALYDQEITYNEAGLSYNEATYAYGGVYGSDFAVIVSHAKNIIPRVIFGGDFSGTASPNRILGRGMLVGMLGMTYPKDTVIIL